MKNIELGTSGLKVPHLAVGCMRMNGLDTKQAIENRNRGQRNSRST